MSRLSRRIKRELLSSSRVFHAPRDEVSEHIFNFLSALDTSKSLAAWILFSNNEHDQLLQLDAVPSDYNDPYKFRSDYTAVKFLSQATFLRTSYDKKLLAYEKFKKFELQCNHTNTRFKNLEFDPLYVGSNVWLLNATIRKISKILGEYSPDEWVDNCHWGPGVTTLLKGAEVSGFNKFHSENGITRDLYSLVGSWFHDAYPLWSDHLTSPEREDVSVFRYEVGNFIVTVPKTSKIDRVIAVEPGINLWFQAGIGSMIRRRLLRFGIDLNSQKKNQRLAYSGSKLGVLATVDFSSASDSIAKELVRVLLPARWLAIMESSRSHYGRLGDELIHWEKFSSMGNGFTFELETLIFFAAAEAVCDYLQIGGVVNVYGDDVILPTQAFNLFSSFCSFMGFTVNQSKTYSTGYFRESCGEHFYDGVSCKPIFLKERIRKISDFYKFANNVRSLAHSWNSFHGCDSRFLPCWSAVHNRVPVNLRFIVPRVAGDTGFIGNLDEARPIRARDYIEGYHYVALTEVGLNRQSDHFAILLQRLWSSGGDRAYNNNYTLRGRTRRAITMPLVQQWYNLGSWF